MSAGEFVMRYFSEIVAGVLLIVAAGIINGTETAFFSLSRGQLYRMRHSDHFRQRLVGLLLQEPKRFLNTLLLSNLVVTTALAAMAALVSLDLEQYGASHWLVAGASLAPLIALILFGEMAPKTLAFVSPQRWSAAVAYPMSILNKALSPILWLLERVLVEPLSRMLAPRPSRGQITADELANLLDLSARRGIIPQDTSSMLQEIVGLTELKVGNIMVPRVDMIAFDINDPPDELTEQFRSSHLRKIPVYDGQPDKVLGVLYGKDLLLKGDRPLRELVVKVPFVPETANVERLLIQFRVTRKQIALVVDEFGGLAGLVTLQDVVEEIVGDIPDRHQEDTTPAVQRVGANRFIVDGDLGIHEWADAFNIDLSTRRISTIGGFVTSLLGHIPKKGDQAAYHNLRFTVLSARGRRIEQLELELVEGQQ